MHRKHKRYMVGKFDAQQLVLLELLPIAIVIHRKGKIQHANASFVNLIGASSIQEVKEKSIFDFSLPAYTDMFQKPFQQSNQAGAVVSPSEGKLVRLDGAIIDVEVEGISVDYKGDHSCLIIFHEMTGRKKAEEALQQSEARYRLIAENMTDLLCIIDWDGCFKYASPSHVTVLGFPSVAYEGKYAGDFMHDDDRKKVREQLDEMVATKEGTVLKFRFKNIRGEWIWLEGKANPIFDENGVFNHFLVVSRDITERLELEEKLTYMAYHDTLTGLPNRRLFKEKLDQALDEAKQTKKKVAVMYLDLDNFKYINDTLGHDVGDELLNQFAQRVKECLGDKDVLSRQGGDEFTILLPGIEEEQDAILIAENIRASFQRAWNIGRNLFTTTSSIGIAFYPANGTKGYELMRNADTALYQAKKDGKNIYRSFSG
ncbi:diguanylate cyclase domain-containing protein [Terribacillus saccharophilus]|uniref:diguanylate cyclase domain-containing protein n=1 Tax=Terribacillus saccharophilus TaxID=361277 RepID=UPI00398275E7